MTTKHFAVWSIGHGQLLDVKLLRELAAATIGKKVDYHFKILSPTHPCCFWVSDINIAIVP